MRRTKYNNGAEVGLKNLGCDECAPLMINGVFCHEHGCPVAWRDYKVECDECGAEFFPTARHQSLCESCRSDGSHDPSWYCDVMGDDLEFMDHEEEE